MVSADDKDAAYPYINTTYFDYGPSLLQDSNYTAAFDNYTSNGTYDFWYDLA